MSNHIKPILIVGAGNMGKEYAKVLNGMNLPFHVFTRSEKTALLFKQKFEAEVSFGDLTDFLKQNPSFEKAIIAVPVQNLKNIGLALIQNGVKEILIEKPGAMNSDELAEMKIASHQKNSAVYIGYNRRFYESIDCLLTHVSNSTPVRSIHFEFTELSNQIEKSKLDPKVKANWLIANSSHVIDLAFFIAGKPQSIHCISSDSLNWHPAAARFTGCGVTENQVLFSYHADWKSPGRWGIEIMTDQHKFFLKPLEKLFIMKHGTFEVNEVQFHQDYDTRYKPGLYKQVEAFLTDKKRLLSISDQIQKINSIYNPILFGN